MGFAQHIDYQVGGNTTVGASGYTSGSGSLVVVSASALLAGLTPTAANPIRITISSAATPANTCNYSCTAVSSNTLTISRLSGTDQNFISGDNVFSSIYAEDLNDLQTRLTGGTGGDLGAGTINVSVGYYVNDVAIGGTGTVTAVTVTPANGVSASVANQGTTPALTFSLGAIAPTSVTTANAVITGGSITGLGTPVNPSDAAIKSYVDASTAGLSLHTSCRLASTANLVGTYSNGTSGVGATLTNSGAQAAFSLDSVSANSGDRVLLKNQSTASQNGIYTVTTVGSGSTNWVLTRATDFNAAAPNGVIEGAAFIVDEGTTNEATFWVETGQGPFTIGTTSITFSQIAGTGGGSGTVNTAAAGELTYYAGTGTAVSGTPNLGYGSSGQLNLAPITAPGSPNGGDVWSDTTQKSLATFQNGVTGYVPILLYNQVAPVTFTANSAYNSRINTTGALGAGNLSFPAGFLNIKGLQLKLSYADTVTTNATTGTYSPVLKLGSNVVGTAFGSNVDTGFTNLLGFGWWELTVLSAGSTATSFTGTLTSGSATVTSVSSFTGLYVGSQITDTTTGGNIPANTYITAINTGASTLTLSQNAAGNGTGDTLHVPGGLVNVSGYCTTFNVKSPVGNGTVAGTQTGPTPTSIDLTQAYVLDHGITFSTTSAGNSVTTTQNTLVLLG